MTNQHLGCAPKCSDGCTYLAPDDALCEHCEMPIAEHIGHKPCIVSPPNNARGLYDLPIFGWAWKEDGRDTRS